jgi:hypothetical protein
MLHAGLDLGRERLDYCLLDDDGVIVETGAVRLGHRQCGVAVPRRGRSSS